MYNVIFGFFIDCCTGEGEAVFACILGFILAWYAIGLTSMTGYENSGFC